jgi:hypothetical protein
LEEGVFLATAPSLVGSKKFSSYLSSSTRKRNGHQDYKFFVEHISRGICHRSSQLGTKLLSLLIHHELHRETAQLNCQKTRTFGA